MAASTFESIIKDLKNKVYHPVYFLNGDESYYIDQIAGYIENHVLSEMEKEFNQTVLYGRDVDVSTIISNAKRYPMMSNFQVVIVREAQDVKDLFPRKKKGGDDDDDDNQKNDDTEKDPLTEYLRKPQRSTILVFCYKYKTVDKRTKSGKLIEKETVFFESKRLYADKIAPWISAYVKSRGYRIGESAAQLLAEYLGVDLSKVSNELDKLMINIAAGSDITAELIERSIGISKDFNVFELQEALAKRDFLKANRIVNYFGANPKTNPLVLTLAALNSYFTKIITYHVYKGKPGINLAVMLGVNPFFMKDYDIAARNYSLDATIKIIGLLHEYDLRSKGVNNLNTTEVDLLKEMVYKILHPDLLPA